MSPASILIVVTLAGQAPPADAAPPPDAQPVPAEAGAIEDVVRQQQGGETAQSQPAEPPEDTAQPPVPDAAPVVERAAPAADQEATTLDVRIRRVSDKLADGIKRLGDVRARRFAVLPFTDVGKKSKDASLGLVVADAIMGNLRRDHGLSVVERARLQEVLGEQALQQSGITNVTDATRMGAMLDADALVLGQVSDVGPDFLLTARVVDVHSSQVLVITEARLPGRELVALSTESVVLRSKSDALFRSMILPGWGQSYNRQPIKSAVFIAAGGLLVVAAVAVLAVLGGTGAYYMTCTTDCQPGNEPKVGPVRLGFLNFSTLRLVMLQAVVGLAVLLGIGGATWTVNIVDAYISGVDG